MRRRSPLQVGWGQGVKLLALVVGIILFIVFMMFVYPELENARSSWYDLNELRLEPHHCSGNRKADFQIPTDNATRLGRPKYVDLTGGGSCRSDCSRVKSYAGLCVMQGNSFSKTLRCLPSLLIIGVMKGGTGAMMRRLNEHSLLQSGKGDGDANEVHYFTSVVKEEEEQQNRGSSNCEWISYAKHFPIFPTSQVKESGMVPLTFDKSPDYIRSPPALRKAKKILPSVKLLVLLRDPVRRAISAFNHNCRHGRYWSIQNRGPVNARMRQTYKSKTVFLRPSGGSSEEIGGSDILRIEWLNKEARAGSLVGCLSTSGSDTDRAVNLNSSSSINCKTIHENDIPLYFAPLRYPCTAEHFRNYTIYALPGEHGGKLSIDEQHQIVEESRRQSSVPAAEELSHGFYVSQLRHLVSIFPSNSPEAHPQVKVMFQEDMLRDTLKAVNKVITWMGLTGLKSLKYIPPPATSSSTLAADIKSLYPEFYRGLTRFYLQRNSGLTTLLGEHRLYMSTPPPWASA